MDVDVIVHIHISHMRLTGEDISHEQLAVVYEDWAEFDLLGVEDLSVRFVEMEEYQSVDGDIAGRFMEVTE